MQVHGRVPFWRLPAAQAFRGYATMLKTGIVALLSCAYCNSRRDGHATGAGATTRIAVATMLSPNDQDPCKHGMGCALLPWCASARRLRDAITRSPILAALSVDFLLVLGKPDQGSLAARRPSHDEVGKICLMSNATEELDMRDCPGVRVIHAGPQLQRVVQLHEDRVIKSGVMSYNPACTCGA